MTFTLTFIVSLTLDLYSQKLKAALRKQFNNNNNNNNNHNNNNHENTARYLKRIEIEDDDYNDLDDELSLMFVPSSLASHAIYPYLIYKLYYLLILSNHLYPIYYIILPHIYLILSICYLIYIYLIVLAIHFYLLYYITFNTIFILV